MRGGRVLSTTLLLAVGFFGPEARAGQGAPPPQVSVTVDPRVELLSIVSAWRGTRNTVRARSPATFRTLKPDWEYTFGLNSESAAGFVSQEGVPLYPVVIRFKTRK